MSDDLVETLAAVPAAAKVPAVGPPISVKGLVAAVPWLVTAAITAALPDAYPVPSTEVFAWLMLATAAALVVVAVFGTRLGRLGTWSRSAAAWFLALGLLVVIWEVLTAKLGLLPRPFFAAPQRILDAYITDWPRILQCVYYSVRLLATGYLTGAAVGFAAGVAIGWSPLAHYWGHPILRVIGPIPAPAWLPIVIFVFPTTFGASVFLIALATAMPVAVLTWSGVASVNTAYYDIARTLGARDRFLVLKVAIPAAMPHVFVGLFMGLCYSFSVLVVAELLGVKAGLGWYLQWSQGWAAYGNMYAGLVVIAALCSGLISLLFFARDRLLAWQKGLLRW